MIMISSKAGQELARACDAYTKAEKASASAPYDVAADVERDRAERILNLKACALGEELIANGHHLAEGD